MKYLTTLSFVFLFSLYAFNQTNMSVSNPEADAIIHGNYDPAKYMPSTIIHHSDSILYGIVNEINSDSLIAWLTHIDTYGNRNTGSDTVSETYGIGGVRRWLHKKFEEFSEANENRLIVSYMDFDQMICGMSHHKNVFAVLPGMDTTKKELLIVEGHYDTRCEDVCDTECYSPGMEDNGSGTVLVMELARVMSKYAFDHTIVFALPTGEDQGLWGAKAFANYFYFEDIDIRACLNNDVIGGIACGMTSSPPSCPYYNHIDSTHVRIFSYSFPNDSSRNSKHKQLARYVQLHQEEDINPLLDTPMHINIILREDRQGRSGDHIPFRQRGYTALRFCSQNEHGDGSGTPPDRQHTNTDILGLDLTTPPDGILDTFFVDPGYLRRNTIMNGVNLGYLALAPPKPDPIFTPLPDGIQFEMSGIDTIYQNYRLAVRSKGSGTLYFDTIYNYSNTTTLVLTELTPEKEYYFSVMNVENNIESLPSLEYEHLLVGTGHLKNRMDINMYQNTPNPFGEQTIINIQANETAFNQKAEIRITDIAGREVEKIPFSILQKTTKLVLDHKNGLQGIYFYSLYIDGQVIQTRKMIVM